MWALQVTDSVNLLGKLSSIELDNMRVEDFKSNNLIENEL
jgi:hypothetical protein